MKDWLQIAQTIILGLTFLGATWAVLKQLRPYLGVSSRWLGPKDNNEPLEHEERDGQHRYSTKVFVTNYGKTPARNVRLHGVCQVLPAALRPDEIRLALDVARRDQRNEAPRTCDPHTSLPLYYRLSHAGPSRLPNHDERVYKFGVITYDDMFGFSHERRFAAYWDGHSVGVMGSGWVPADQHNDAD